MRRTIKSVGATLLCIGILALTGCTSIMNNVIQKELGYTNAEVEALQITPDPDTKLTRTTAMLVGAISDLIQQEDATTQTEVQPEGDSTADMSFINEPEPIGKEEIFEIPVENGSIPMVLVWPKNYQKQKEPIPVVMMIHGGSYNSGDYNGYRRFTSILANELKAVIAFPEYRLAPEYKFPTAPDDVYAAWRWLLVHAQELGLDTGKTAIAGDSAGGNLAAGLSIRLYANGEPQPDSVALLYPNLTLTPTVYPSRLYFGGVDGKTYLLTGDMMQRIVATYLEDPSQATAPYASPLVMIQGLVQIDGVVNELAPYALDATLPVVLAPTLVIVAQADPLRDEAILYSAVLRHVGTESTATVYKGMLHGFPMFDKIFAEGRKAIRQTADFISEHWK